MSLHFMRNGALAKLHRDPPDGQIYIDSGTLKTLCRMFNDCNVFYIFSVVVYLNCGCIWLRTDHRLPSNSSLLLREKEQKQEESGEDEKTSDIKQDVRRR